MADFLDFKCETLAEVDSAKLVIFIVSTYGEGDPPENATKFDHWLQNSSDIKHLANLQYAILGLGNSNYKYYNRFALQTHEALQRAGGNPVLDLSLADDAHGLTREEFSLWKERLFEVFIQQLGIAECPKEYEPVLMVTPSDNEVVNEEICRPLSLETKQKAKSTETYSVLVKLVQNITPKSTRTILNIDIDISNEPKLKYSSGDHLAVWPENPASEIRDLSMILGISEEEMHRPVKISSRDCDFHIPWPHPVNFHTIFKHHLNIAGLVSRDLIRSLRQFTSNTSEQTALDTMAREYRYLCTTQRMTLASVLTSASSGSPWVIPMSFVLENMEYVKPRYYSIASTPTVSPRTISLTVAAKQIELGSQGVLHGLMTRHLLGMQQLDSVFLSDQLKLWCSVRKTKFKPPVSPFQPMIMVANGSGIAPFLGFIRHRLRSFQLKNEVGDMILFYGCQDESVHLYKDEIDDALSIFSGKLHVVTAYSRNGGGYVQNCMQAHSANLRELLCNKNASVYMCGSTSMARSVRQELLKIIKQQEGWTESQAQSYEVSQLKMGKWQLDVWG